MIVGPTLAALLWSQQAPTGSAPAATAAKPTAHTVGPTRSSAWIRRDMRLTTAGAGFGLLSLVGAGMAVGSTLHYQRVCSGEGSQCTLSDSDVNLGLVVTGSTLFVAGVVGVAVSVGLLVRHRRRPVGSAAVSLSPSGLRLRF